jgi:hypothetical protein
MIVLDNGDQKEPVGIDRQRPLVTRNEQEKDTAAGKDPS